MKRATAKRNVIPLTATLHTDAPQGESTQTVRLVGETPAHYRIMPTPAGAIRLAADRWLRVGETALVPKRVITIE